MREVDAATPPGYGSIARLAEEDKCARGCLPFTKLVLVDSGEKV